MSLASPDLGSDYLIEGLLLEHGPLQFYRAKQPDGQALIVKCLQLNQLKDWSLIQALEYEAEVLGQLRHPRLPQLLELRETAEQLCLIQSRIPGETLQQRWRATGTLSEAEVLQLAIQVLRILEALHSHHPPVLHLDIKPSNLMQDPDGQIYLIDFGTAVMGQHDWQSFGGTPGFSPPEQLSGQACPASDLYALGATCIQLLSGFEITTLLDSNRIDFWQHLEASVPFKNWLEIMVHPDVQLRFESARQAAEQLLNSFPQLEKVASQVPRQLTPAPSRLEQQSVASREARPPQLAGYRFLSCLKRVGGTESWLAEDTAHAQKVVVKRLQIAQAAHLNELRDFEREVENLSALQHPAFPQLLQVEKGEQEWLLVQSCLPGDTLQQKVTQHWQPSPELLFAEIASQLLMALKGLHEQQPPLIHRDLQPENILLQETPKGIEVSLLDFGGAAQRLLQTGSGGSTRTGSFGYTAPEQYLGQHSPQSDLFSLGMCLIYALRQRSPASYCWEQQMLDLSDLALDKGLKAWLQRLTHLDPAQRPASAEDARVALLPQLQLLADQRKQESFQAQKQERLDALRVAENRYTHTKENLGYQLNAHPWGPQLQALGLGLPPTLRLELAPATEHFQLLFPAPTPTRETTVMWLQKLLRWGLGFAIFGFLLGLLFPPLWLLLMPYVALWLYFQKLKPFLYATQLTLGPEGLSWHKQPWGHWHLSGRHTGGQLPLSTPQSPEHSLSCQLQPIHTPWPLKGSYYCLQWRDPAADEQAPPLAQIPYLLVLDKEAPWLQQTLPTVLKFQSSGAVDSES